MSRAVVFEILIGMFFGWLVLVAALYLRIRHSHPREYAAMGRPTLWPGDPSGTSFYALAFVFSRKHKRMGDTGLSVLSDLMVAFIMFYGLLFVSEFLTFWI